MRRHSFTALVLAVLFVVASFWLAQLHRDNVVDSQDRALMHDAAEERSALDAYFERARAITKLMAQNPAFRDFYAAPGSRRAKVRANGRQVRRASAALAYLERLYPNSIGEACFIDRRGPENARAVQGRIAPPSQLSPDESGNPFFRPTFARRPGEVYQARPYVSPDTGEWVISNSTPVPSGGASRAIVHFEVTIESFRRAAAGTAGRVAIRVVDGQTGAVVIDSRRRQRKDAALGIPRDRRFVALRRAPARAGRFSAPGMRAAYQRVGRTRGNANDWLVLATAAAPSSSLLAYFGGDSTAMLAAAALLLGLALFSRRTRALRREAETDELTGLANRRHVLKALAAAVDASLAGGPPTALLVLDLDRFKELNDTLGHHAGDLLLQQLGPRLRASLRGSDVLARLGGDEFAIVLREGLDGAERVAERVRAELERAFMLQGLAVHVGASIGIAVCPDHATDASTLMQRADVAMYQAKEARSGCQVYAPERDIHSRERLALASELHRALAEGELVLHYQPQVDLHSGRLAGVEALMRWQHPQRGLLAPGAFIATAEQMGLMPALTRFAIDTALRQCAAWRRDGIDLGVAVNVTAADLIDTSFPDEITRALAAHGVPPELLQLEITEQTLFSDSERVLDVLARLSELGVSFALDDFGTGYSSLAHLKRLPVQELKIDRSFVMAMAEHDDDAAIVRSTIELAHNLRLRVVAEGVEDAATLAQLRALGCDSVQGYLISRPVDAAELAERLDDRLAGMLRG